jgi:acyl-CoA thioesterase-1
MSAVLYLFGSGLAFWLGTGLVLAGFCGRLFGKQKWHDRLAVYVVDFGLVLSILSAVPLPYAAYAALLAITILWLATEKSPRPFWQQRRAALRICFLAAWLLAMAWELPYQFIPTVAANGGSIHVIGDSITAGLGDKSVPWPAVLARSRNLDVHSHARAGATTAQAVAQAEALSGDVEIVIVEIGGNDMLSSLPVAEFAAHLDRLLALVRGKANQVAMFELPLPPLSNENGRVQREIAARHKVSLIPKRVLMGVLSAGGATSDSVHLTQAGHDQLAACVSRMIR